MNHKNPKYTFLNTNPNPSLGDLIRQFQLPKKNPTTVLRNFRDEISALKIPMELNKLIKTFEQQLSQKELFESKYTLKAIKNAAVFKTKKKLQNHFYALHQLIDEAYNNTPHDEALFLLCDLIFLNHSIYTPLSKIKEQVTIPVFNLYIGFQTIGCVNGDGWAFGIFGNMPQMVPYIPDTMQLLGYPKVAQAVTDAINVFPKEAEFLFDNQKYIDVLNFIENPRHPLETSLLNQYSQEERQTMNEQYTNALHHIEEVEDEIWNGEGEWAGLIQYYDENLEEKIWRDANNQN